MKPRTLSIKQSHSLESLYQRAIEAYYESPAAPQVATLILINRLVGQCVQGSDRYQPDKLVSMLEVLSLKARKEKDLVASIAQAVAHLKAPRDAEYEQEIWLGCLAEEQLYEFTCLSVERLWVSKLVNLPKQKMVAINLAICSNLKFNPEASLQTINHIVNSTKQLKADPEFLRALATSLLSSCDSIINSSAFVSRLLALLMTLSICHRGNLWGLQVQLCSIFYLHPEKSTKFSELMQLCYSQQYCAQVVITTGQAEEIDRVFVWSYSTPYCWKVTQGQVQSMEDLLIGVEEESSRNKLFIALRNMYQSGNGLQFGLRYDVGFNGRNVSDSKIQWIRNQGRAKIEQDREDEAIESEEPINRFSKKQCYVASEHSDNTTGKIQSTPQSTTYTTETKPQPDVSNIYAKESPTKQQIVKASADKIYTNVQKTPIAPTTDTSVINIYAKEPALRQTRHFQQPADRLFFAFMQVVVIKRGFQHWRKRVEKSGKRLRKLNEWANSEVTYYERLIKLRDLFREPLLKNDLMTEEQARKTFPNLESMIVLSMQMQAQLKKLLASWHPIHTELGPTIKYLSNFFKIYKDFSFNYPAALALMAKIEKKPKYSQVIKEVFYTDYFFYPIERLTKYHLIAKDYIHYMPKWHKDYQNMCKAHQLLMAANDQVNQNIQFQEQEIKKIELDQKYGNIMTNSRHYIMEIPVTYCGEECDMHIFNDFLLLCRRSNKKEVTRVELNWSSFIVRKPDSLCFANRLYICGKDLSIHVELEAAAKESPQKELEPGEQQSKKPEPHLDKCFRVVSQVIEVLYQNEFKRSDLISQTRLRRAVGINDKASPNVWRYQKLYEINLRCEVIAIEKRAYRQSNMTFVIVRVCLPKPLQISQILYINMEVLCKLQKHLHQIHDKEAVKIPEIEIKNRNVEDISKISEYLCQCVEVFINFIVRNRVVSQKPEVILHHLGLHETLWQFIEEDKNDCHCNCQSCKHCEIYIEFSYYWGQKQLLTGNKFRHCIINALQTQNTIKQMLTREQFQYLKLEQRLIWAQCRQNRLDYRLHARPNFGNPLDIRVYTRLLSEEKELKLYNVTTAYTCRQVIEVACMKLGIECTLDLGLVLIMDEETIYLDDDQSIALVAATVNDYSAEAAKITQKQRNSKEGIFGNIDWRNTFSASKKVKKVSLQLRKLFIFNQVLEQQASLWNKERLPFLMGEFLRKFKAELILLSLQDIRAMCAYVYACEYYAELKISSIIKVDPDNLKRYLPTSRHNFITEEFSNKVALIVKQQLDLHDQVASLYGAFFKHFGQKLTWHSQHFPLKSTQGSLIFNNASTVIMAVCYKKVSLLEQKSLKAFTEYPINSFKYWIYSDSLFVESYQKVHRFKCVNPIAVQKMIETYRLIYQFERQL